MQIGRRDMMLGLSLSICSTCGNCEPVFDPTTLALTGWWRTNYIGSPWLGEASASTSGTQQIQESTNAPSVGGVSLNGLTVADFDGTNDVLNDLPAVTLDAYVTASAWWMGVLCHVDAAAATAGAFYDDAAIVADKDGGWGISVSSSGIRACNDVDTNFQTTPAVVIGGSWAWAEAWLSGGVLSCAVNGGTAQIVAAGNLRVFSTRQLRVGANYNNTKFFNGQIAEIMIMASVPTALQRASIRTNYLRSRYALTLGS